MKKNLPKWPHKYEWISELGYVVWRDVFEGDMRCTLREAVLTHKVATFVCEEDALDYCGYMNNKVKKLKSTFKGN